MSLYRCVESGKTLLVTLIFLGCSPLAFAYIGPGAGLGAIGAFLAVVGAVLLAIIGFFWYPLKRLFGKKTSDGSENEILEPIEPADEASAKTEEGQGRE